MTTPPQSAASTKVILCRSTLEIEPIHGDVVPLEMDYLPGNPPLPTAEPAESDDVWAPDVRQEFGRPFVILRPGGGPPAVVTGGPILFVGSKAYQVTAGDVFTPWEDEPLLPSAETDLELESLASTEQSDIESQRNSHDLSFKGCDGHIGQDEDCVDNLYGTRQHQFSATSTTPGRATVESKGKELEIPRNYLCIGMFVGMPIPHGKNWLNYGLVELKNSGGGDRNAVFCGSLTPLSSGKVNVTKLACVKTLNARIPVIVARSSGSIGGTLDSTLPHSIKPRYQMCHETYIVSLGDGHLFEPKDCGAGVISRTGEFLGHIVHGDLAEPFAFMLPATRVLADIARVFKGEPSFTRPKVEFASPDYHEKTHGQKLPSPHHLVSLKDALLDNTVRKKQSGRDRTRARTKEIKPFDFFSLPPEIRDAIIRELPFRSAMNLRQCSRQWRNAVSANSSAISEVFLKRNPLPPLAQRLYPHPSQTLPYIQEVGHRHAVVSRLAAHITKWLRSDIYLYKSRYQQPTFESARRQIQRRLMPPLFVAFHFFEMYPDSLLRQLEINFHSSTPSPVESRMMRLYDDDILLQTHQVLQILFVFFDRILRPASYYGRLESWIRRARRKPSDEFYSAILCIGGLEAVEKLAGINDYSQRRDAADRLYASLRSPQMEPRFVSSASVRALGASDLYGFGPTEGRDVRSSFQRREVGQEEWSRLLRILPVFGDIWRPTGERVLVERQVVARKQEIKSYRDMLDELIRPERSALDQLYEGHLLWQR